MASPTHAVLISTHLQKDPSFAAGVHKRLDVLMEALTGVVERVTALFLVRWDSGFTETERREHEVYLSKRWSVSISLRVEPVRLPPSGAGWQSLIAGMFDFYRTPRFRSFDNEGARAVVAAVLAGNPRIVLVHRLEAMSVVLRVAPTAGTPRVIFDLDDIEHVAAFRRLVHDPSWPAERLRLLHLPSLMAGERRAIRRAAATLICSPRDKRYLDTLFRTGSVRVVPNTTAVSEAPLPVSLERTVLFVGTFEYAPNIQAADRLVRSVWPRIRAAVPDARLLIVGKHPENIPAFSAQPRDSSITFAGFVPDLRAAYAGSRVACCPIRVGGGTRIKIIEAAGYGRPVVSTPVGAEGLELRDGTEILLGRRDRDLAAACCRLLLDEEAARKVGLAAWERARQSYDRAAVIRRLRELYTQGD